MQFEKILLQHGWEKFSNWECLFVKQAKELFLSVYVENIKLAGKKQTIDPMWKILMKDIDLEEPTSFFDDVHLCCTHRECQTSKDLVDNSTVWVLRESWRKIKAKFQSRRSVVFSSMTKGYSAGRLYRELVSPGRPGIFELPGDHLYRETCRTRTPRISEGRIWPHHFHVSPDNVLHKEKVSSIARQTYGKRPADDLNDVDVFTAVWIYLCLSLLRL